ncbi:hypothetical protein AVEN_103042-1 [Araneus ventricosus]|uniref:Uncharacterized protein n=1 Tax=Araneus ventricosus TaxID=182803 RepID=A0A4Y2B7L4_ARAVE|nr:hypothetical protein AVEN_103042-1 [Araneus ventricosus]
MFESERWLIEIKKNRHAVGVSVGSYGGLFPVSTEAMDDGCDYPLNEVHISRIKNSKSGSTKNDSKPIKNGRQSKLKASDLQRLEKMASKPDPPTQASMDKALNLS